MVNRKKVQSRRDFLSKAFSGLVSIPLLGFSHEAGSSQDMGIIEKPPKKEIICRMLGRTGLKLPIVNMGVKDANNPALVEASYGLGVRHFDTAAYYMRGRTEEMLGNVIEKLNVRKDVIIATKVLTHTPRSKLSSAAEAEETFLRLTEESLKRLKTDYIDILYLHDVIHPEDLNSPGIQKAMGILKKQKKARFIGFSTHKVMVEGLNEAARTGFYDVVLTAFNYSMFDNQEMLKAIERAASKGIGIIAMKTQAGQPQSPEFDYGISKEFYEGQKIHTALLKWALRNEHITCAIPGYMNFQQMEEDFSVAYDLGYTPDEEKFLRGKNVQLAMKSFCQQCDSCLPTCSKGVDIPTLMRVFMYASSYRNIELAGETFDSIPQDMSLERCASCDECRAKCIRSVDISKRIAELKAIFA